VEKPRANLEKTTIKRYNPLSTFLNFTKNKGDFLPCMLRCILFDRDGTLGELVDKRYPATLIPYCDVKTVFEKIKEKGYLVGILSNQSSIARGTGIGYDFDKEFLSYGADIWEICPHDTQDNCDCRKPKSGLLLKICNRLQLSPSQCLVVGDRLSDIQCAKNVGAHASLVLTGYGKDEEKNVCSAFPDVQIFSRFDDILKIL